MTRTLWKALAAVVAVPVLVMGTYQVATRWRTTRGPWTRRCRPPGPASSTSTTRRGTSASSAWRVPPRSGSTPGSATAGGPRPTTCGWRATAWCCGRAAPSSGPSSARSTTRSRSPPTCGSRPGARGISVTDLASDVYVESDASRIEVARINGDVTVRSDQGRIEATELDVRPRRRRRRPGLGPAVVEAPPQSIVAEADQGSIEIVLPKVPGVAYASDAAADQGSVTELIDEAPDGDRTISAHADQGDVRSATADPDPGQGRRTSPGLRPLTPWPAVGPAPLTPLYAFVRDPPREPTPSPERHGVREGQGAKPSTPPDAHRVGSGAAGSATRIARPPWSTRPGDGIHRTRRPRRATGTAQGTIIISSPTNNRNLPNHHQKLPWWLQLRGPKDRSRA